MLEISNEPAIKGEGINQDGKNTDSDFIQKDIVGIFSRSLVPESETGDVDQNGKNEESLPDNLCHKLELFQSTISKLKATSQ